MSSDSEDDEQLKQFLEAADTTLLNNAMFQGKVGDKSNAEETLSSLEEQKPSSKDNPKSQRYISNEFSSNATDFNLPDSMQKHMTKKFNDILKQTYEFYDAPVDTHTIKKIKIKNRVRLLHGCECYVNAYEDFEYATKGPEKKPIIKRRCIEEDSALDASQLLESVVVDGDAIMSDFETKSWAKKKERKDKIFYYKNSSHGAIHAIGEINEFTSRRRKNKWNESKIRDYRVNKNLNK